MAQYDDLARWYDPLYDAAGKDPAAEARALVDVAQRLGVRPASLLDVACGTGRHLATFREIIDEVVGIDNAPAMLEMVNAIALRKGFGDLLAEGSARASAAIGRRQPLTGRSRARGGRGASQSRGQNVFLR